MEIESSLEKIRKNILLISNLHLENIGKLKIINQRSTQFFETYSYAKEILIENIPGNKEYSPISNNLTKKISQLDENHSNFSIIVEILKKQLEVKITTLNHTTTGQQLLSLLNSFDILLGNNYKGLENLDTIRSGLITYEKSMSTVNSGTQNILAFIAEVRNHILDSNHVLVQMSRDAYDQGIDVLSPVPVQIRNSVSNVSNVSSSVNSNGSSSPPKIVDNNRKSQTLSSGLSHSISSISSNSVAESVHSNPDNNLKNNNNVQNPENINPFTNPGLDADSQNLKEISEKMEFLYYKLISKTDDRRKLLNNGESFYKLGKLVTEILHDLEEKYTHIIAEHKIQTGLPMSTNGSVATTDNESENNNSNKRSTHTSSSNQSQNSNEDSFCQELNLENMNLDQIKEIKISHMDEKQKFLQAVATFTRSAGEFYKLFQNYSINNRGFYENDMNGVSSLDLNERAAIEYKKAVGGLLVTQTPPRENWVWVVEFVFTVFF